MGTPHPLAGRGYRPRPAWVAGVKRVLLAPGKGVCVCVGFAWQSGMGWVLSHQPPESHPPLSPTMPRHLPSTPFPFPTLSLALSLV
jgi:hypothetical protein